MDEGGEKEKNKNDETTKTGILSKAFKKKKEATNPVMTAVKTEGKTERFHIDKSAVGKTETINSTGGGRELIARRCKLTGGENGKEHTGPAKKSSLKRQQSDYRSSSRRTFAPRGS